VSNSTQGQVGESWRHQTDVPAQPAELGGLPSWVMASLGLLAAILALAGGLAVLAARRAGRRARVGHAARPRSQARATLDGLPRPPGSPTGRRRRACRWIRYPLLSSAVRQVPLSCGPQCGPPNCERPRRITQRSRCQSELVFDSLFRWGALHDPDLGRPIAAPLERCGIARRRSRHRL